MDIDHRRIILSFFLKLEGLVVEEWFYPRPHTTLSLIKQNNRSDLPSNKDPSATAKGGPRKIDFHKIALNISKELGFFYILVDSPYCLP